MRLDHVLDVNVHLSDRSRAMLQWCGGLLRERVNRLNELLYASEKFVSSHATYGADLPVKHLKPLHCIDLLEAVTSVLHFCGMRRRKEYPTGTSSLGGKLLTRVK